MFPLTPLPYDYTALLPHMSKETLIYHHTKHHATYVDNLNKLLPMDLKSKSLEEVVRISEKYDDQKLFNNAAQVWNHEFFWKSMSASDIDHTPSPRLLNLIEKSFGSFKSFEETFKAVALTQFGSGWAWLVFCKKTNNLSVISTSNAKTPLTNDDTVPLLTCDVWEHAYYVDHPAQRGAFLDTFLKHLINYTHAEEILIARGLLT